MGVRDVWPLLKTTVADWVEDDAPRHAAALAYYTAFALAPVLVIAIAVAGLAFDSAQVRADILEQVGDLLGPSGAELVGGMLESASARGRSIPAMLVGLAAILIGATGLFGALQGSLNAVWEVEVPRGRGLLGVLRTRFLSFTMVVGVGFLLLVSLVFSAAVAALGRYAGRALPAWPAVLQAGNFVLGFLFTTALFAMIYKVLPDVRLRWRDVWTGAAVTAALFTVGRVLIGLYLGRSSVGSAYGAAGSLAIVLLWVYYSSQILLLGAEFTQAHARWRGAWIEPKGTAAVAPGAHKGAVRAGAEPRGEARALQGQPPTAPRAGG